MRKSTRHFLIGAGAAAAIVVTCLVVLSQHGTAADPQEVLKALAGATPPGRVAIEYPLDETLFPPDISSPCFRWKDGDPRCDTWLVTIEFADGRQRVNCFVAQPQWRPETLVWEEIKSRSVAQPAVVTIAGINRATPSQVLSAGRVAIATSSDAVGRRCSIGR